MFNQKSISNATITFFDNGSIGEWFKTSVGMRQWFLPSSMLVNVFLGGRQLTNLRFADDIDGLARTKSELCQLVSRLERASKDYGIEISGEKTKLITNNNNDMTMGVQISLYILLMKMVPSQKWSPESLKPQWHCQV